jgi:hypothetical protein
MKVPAESVLTTMLTSAFDSCKIIPKTIPSDVESAKVIKGHKACLSWKPDRWIEVPSATAAAPLCKAILMHSIKVKSNLSLMPAATPSSTECKQRAKLKARAELLLISDDVLTADSVAAGAAIVGLASASFCAGSAGSGSS